MELQLENQDINQDINQEENKAPDTITVDGAVFKRVDFINGFTFAMQKEAKKFLPEIGKLISKIQKAQPKDLNPQDENEILEKMGQVDLGMMYEAMGEYDIDVKILALLYIPEEDKNFKAGKYKKRIELFEENLVKEPWMEVLIQDFFDTKIVSVMKDFRIFSGLSGNKNT